MYELFNDRVISSTGGSNYPEFRRVRDGLRASIDKVRQYRVDNPMSLTASHPLVRLLMSVNVPLSLDKEVYRDLVSEVTYRLARNMRMSSPVSRGDVFTPSMFYGDGVSDVVLLHDEEFDITDIESTWRDLQPIRVLYHPKTDLNLEVPDGRFASEETGLSVVTINLPMLALQFKYWRAWERGVVADESPRTVMMFLQAHPLPNMLYSHLDCAIFNRVFSRFFDLPLPKVKSRNPYYLINYSTEVDAVIDKYLTQMANRRADFDTLIDHMPVAGYDSRYETLRLPNVPFTYQYIWAVIIARLAQTMFMVQIDFANHSPRNRTAMAYLKRFFTKVDQNNALLVALPTDRYQEIKAVIDEGIKPYLNVT